MLLSAIFMFSYLSTIYMLGLTVITDALLTCDMSCVLPAHIRDFRNIRFVDMPLLYFLNMLSPKHGLHLGR